jgi:hypothetical protein
MNSTRGNKPGSLRALENAQPPFPQLSDVVFAGGIAHK